MFWRPSPFVAAEPSWSASRCLAMPSTGMRITLEIASPIPTQLCRAARRRPAPAPTRSPRRARAGRTGSRRASARALGGRGEHPLAGEAPDDDHAREALDRAVEAEADERDRAGDDAGRDRDAALDGHPGEAQPREQCARGGRAGGRSPRRCRGSGAAAPRSIGSSTAHARDLLVEHGRQQRAAAVGQPVQHHLAVAPALGEPERAQRAERGGRRGSRRARRPRRGRRRTARPRRPSAAATISRVGSASARACSASAAARSASSRSCRSRSAFSRSRQRRSQRSSATASS